MIQQKESNMNNEQRENDITEAAKDFLVNPLGLPLLLGSQVLVTPEHDYAIKGVVLEYITADKVKVEGRKVGSDDETKEEGTFECNLYDIEKVDGRHVLKRLQGWRGSHSKAGIVVKVGTKQQLQGIDEADIMWMGLKFMADQARTAQDKLKSAHISIIMRQAQELRIAGGYVELDDLAKTLLKEALDGAEADKDDELSQFWRTDIALRLKLMQMGHQELAEIFNQRGLEKFPVVLERLQKDEDKLLQEVESIFRTHGIKSGPFRVETRDDGSHFVRAFLSFNEHSMASVQAFERAMTDAGFKFSEGDDNYAVSKQPKKAQPGERPAEIEKHIVQVLKGVGITVEEIKKYDFVGVPYYNTYCQPVQSVAEVKAMEVKVAETMKANGYRVALTAHDTTFDIVWEGDVK
jgi:hypothetical protein